MNNQKGAVPLLILIAVIGVVSFLAVSSVLPFKDRLLSSVFPKNESSAATGFPTGFSEVRVGTGLSSPTNMEFAPDGRLFINERGGKVKIFKNGALLPTPFLDLGSKVTTAGSERGMMGIAFDPSFATDPNSKYVYLYYANASTVKNRVVRYKVSASNPDLADPASEQVLLDTIASDAGNHNGGSLNFGADGKLYITTGDGGSNHASSQDLNSLSGKVLRINKDGTVPNDNPYFGQSGKRSEIWASGLRNPFTSEVDPVSGVHYINDVGEGTWEEIDQLAKGANYGWPTCEATCSTAGFTNPVYQYGRSDGNTVTGGAFYRYTGTGAFPSDYQGDYFFSDYGSSFIKRMDQTTKVVTNFASNGNQPVDIKIGPDGALYYLAIGNGSLYQIIAGNVPSPTPTPTPIPGAQTLTFDDISGQNIPINGEYPANTIDWGTNKWVLSAPWKQFTTKSFSFNGAGTSSNTFSILIPKRLVRFDAFNGGTATSTISISCSGNTTKTVTLAVDQLMTIDTGWTNNCSVVTLSSSNGWDTNFDNLVLTDAVIGSPAPSASPNASPAASIATPASGAFYNAGDTINFSGTGTDPEDGTLPASAFNWSVVFHHDTHTHPFFDTIAAGQKSGSFQIPNQGEVSDNVWYRIHLTVTDSKGATNEVIRDIMPRKANITITTNPPGLQVKVDDQPKTSPYTVAGVVGMVRAIGVDSPQTLNSTTYQFTSWSDGGAGDRHTITTPSANTTYTATFQAVTGSPAPSAGGTQTIIFDDLGTNMHLNGIISSVPIDWGNFLWHSKNTDPVNGQFPTEHLSFNDPGMTNANFTFTSPKILYSLDINNRLTSGSSTVTITCSPNPAKNFTIAPTAIINAVTGWTSPCTTVNIATSNTWNTRFDNLVISGSGTSSPSPAASIAPSSSPKPGDVDGNGKVDIFDYNILLTNFGKTGIGIAGDLDKNNKVDIFDYNLVLSNFGK